ncbi:MAG: gliding motility lipoprotein GldH [Bacteroidales bacterium]|nr:gliding motility lipoprotein GldH [Bacteroidales bacterium]
MMKMCQVLLNQIFNPFIRTIISPSGLILPGIIFFFTGCSTSSVYDQNKSFRDDVWKSDQIVRFDVELEDTMNIHKFYLNLRHTTSYRYANIFLFINTTFPDGTEARDTVECILADPSGKWMGKGISNIRDNQVLLRRGLRFPQKGTYIFEFEQAMREPELKEVMDIGLRIVRE